MRIPWKFREEVEEIKREPRSNKILTRKMRIGRGNERRCLGKTLTSASQN